MRYIVFAFIFLASFYSYSANEIINVAELAETPELFDLKDHQYHCEFSSMKVLQETGRELESGYVHFYLVYNDHLLINDQTIIALVSDSIFFEGRGLRDMPCMYHGVDRYNTVSGRARQMIVLSEVVQIK